MEGPSKDDSLPTNRPNNEVMTNNNDSNSESTSASRNKRGRLKHTWVQGRGGIAEAWVLLDAEGNTQQVFEHEVDILLGGRSVDTVLATIPSHPIRSPALNKVSQSNTNRRLEPIIQESLLMLRRENVVGESDEPKHLGLERKAENMLMHFTQPQLVPTDLVQQAPSVHFVDIEPDRILLWRHSQDFDGGNENFNRPFIYERMRHSAYDQESQESDDKHPMEINSETDINDFYSSNQLKETKSTTSLKKKGMKLINKFLSKSKAESCCSDALQTERRGFTSDLKHSPPIGSISSIILKLEEENSKYKENALLSEKRLREIVQANNDLKRKLKEAYQKEKHLNKFLAKEQERRTINYTASPIYDLLSNSELESNVKGTSMLTHEQSLERLVMDIQDLKTTIFDSENQVKQSIVKYIADKQLERDLLQAIGSYCCKKTTGEQNIISLSKTLIEEQAEKMKQFRLSSESQEALLRKRNQLLEEENIVLLKKFEKMQTRDIRNPNEASVTDALSYPFNEIHCFSKNNDKLRDKVNNYQARVEKLEVQLATAQDKSDHLETLLRSNKIEIENQKMLNGRLEADHEMECSAIKSELAMKSQILQQSTEVADILVDDIDSLKVQLKETGTNVQIDWRQLQNGNYSLANLLHMSRIYINEMGRELITLQMKINQAYSEILCHRNQQEKLGTMLEETNQKKNLLKSRLVEAINGKEKCNNKSEKLFQEIDRLQEHLDQATQKSVLYQEEIRKLRQEYSPEQMERIIQRALGTTSAIGLDAHIKKLTEEKYHILEKLKSTEQKVKELQTSLSEAEEKNNNYVSAMKELQQSNSELNREFGMLHEQCQFGDVSKDHLHEMEREMYTMSAEKACLADKLQQLTGENKKLLESSHNFLTQTQCFQNDLDMLVQENSALKMQHEADQSVLICLGKQARFAAGDEQDCHANAMKFMQTELMTSREKVLVLERAIEINNKKIKDLEKELGIVEKDACIKDFDIEFAQLANTSQMEILALEQKKEHMEINILSLNRDNREMTANISVMRKEIDALSGKLHEKENQLEKYTYLEKELDCNYAIDIQRREENSELKGRLKDFNNLMNQRDKLIENQREFLIEAENLHGNLKRRDKKIASLNRDCVAKTSEIGELKEKLYRSESLINEIKEIDEIKLQGVQEELQTALKKLIEYERHLNLMDYDIEKHSCKMSGELGFERKEKEILEDKVNQLKIIIDGNQISLDQALKQIGSLRIAEKDLKSALEEERMRRYDAEIMLKKLKADMKESVHILQIIDNEKEQYNHLNNEYHQYKETVSKFNEDMESKVGVFKQELTVLKAERDALTRKIAEVEVRNHTLQENCNDFQKNLTELNLERSNNMEQIKLLLREMKGLGLTKYRVELTAREEKRSRENLELNHRELSAKLLEAVRMVIYEKMGRERIESQCQEFDSVIEKLLDEKKQYEEKMLKLKEDVQELETRVNILNSDKQKVEFHLKAALDNEKDLKLTNEKLRKRHAEIQREMLENSVSKKLSDFEKEALRANEESTRLYEERLERLTNELKETREQLLSRGLEESRLQKKIAELQCEKSILSQQLRALEGVKSEEMEVNKTLRKACGNFLEEYDAEVPFTKSIKMLRDLIRPWL